MECVYTVPEFRSCRPLHSPRITIFGRYSIGRAWSEVCRLPTQEQIAARPADRRSPYLYTWLKIGQGVRYDAYCVDFKSDHIPKGTYSALFNGSLDLSGLKEQYFSRTSRTRYSFANSRLSSFSLFTPYFS